MFTKRTRKGKKESEPIFVQSAPIFEERMKQLRVGEGISNFKALKYETWTPNEKKEIRELVLEKMVTWKYSLEKMQPQIHANLFAKIKVRWENTVQNIKDICKQ